MRGLHVYVTIIAVLFGFALGWGLFARSSDANIEQLRTLAADAQRELAESERALREARDANRKLVDTNTDLRDSLEEAAEHNRQLADRNRRITGSLIEAERDLELAVGETSELSELLARIIGIVDSLFAGDGIIGDVPGGATP